MADSAEPAQPPSKYAVPDETKNGDPGPGTKAETGEGASAQQPRQGFPLLLRGGSANKVRPSEADTPPPELDGVGAGLDSDSGGSDEGANRRRRHKFKTAAHVVGRTLSLKARVERRLINASSSRIMPYKRDAHASVWWKDAAKKLRGGWSAASMAGDARKRMVTAARDGRIETVRALLNVGVDVNSCVCAFCELTAGKPCQQTALIKAVRFGRLQTARMLLEWGASATAVDAKGRDAMYYAMYSGTVREQQHKHLVSLLLEYTRVTSRILHMAALTSEHSEVVPAVMESLGRHLIKRSRDGTSRVVFDDLHLLDDSSDAAAIFWPNKTRTAVGASPFEELGLRSRAALRHPSMLALIFFKYDRWGLRMYITEFALHILWVISVSVVCGIVATGSDVRGGDPYPVNDYDGGLLDTTRAVFESIMLAISILCCVLEIWTWCSLRPALRKEFPAWPKLCVYLVPMTYSLLHLFAATEVAQINLLAVAVVVAWLHFLPFCQFLPVLGEFFITIGIMLKKDLTRFAAVLAIVIPGFALALGMMYSNNRELYLAEESAEWTPGLLSAAYHASMFLSGAGEYPGGHGHPSWVFSGLVLLFVVLGPLLSLNLLIAQLSNTYETVHTQSREEWVYRMCTYQIRRQGLLSPESALIDRQRDGRRVMVVTGSVWAAARGDYPPDNQHTWRGQGSAELQERRRRSEQIAADAREAAAKARHSRSSAEAAAAAASSAASAVDASAPPATVPSLSSPQRLAPLGASAASVDQVRHLTDVVAALAEDVAEIKRGIASLASKE